MTRRATAVLLLGAVVLGACAQGVSDSPQAWIDTPLNGWTLPLGPVEVVSHASDLSGISTVEFSVNGAVIASGPPEDGNATLVTSRFFWQADQEGTFTLQVRGQGTSGAWSEPATVVITVSATTPTPTATPTSPNTPTPTWTPTPACIDKAAFVADITIPDDTLIPPGASFTKTWRLRNDGSCPWTEEYKVVFVSGDPMNNPTPVPIPGTVPPGATVDISLALVAPTTPGTYHGNYMIRNPQGVNFGVGANGQTPFYVAIVSGTAPTRTPTPPPAPDTQPPSVSISHSPATPYNNDLITLSANASDNRGVTRIDIRFGPAGGTLPIVKTCTNTASCTFQGGPYLQGPYEYLAWAYDAAGNSAHTPVQSLTVVPYVAMTSDFEVLSYDYFGPTRREGQSKCARVGKHEGGAGEEI